jgi:hypothetical protein
VTLIHQDLPPLVKVVGVEDTSYESPAPTEPPPVIVLRTVEQQREEKRGEIALLLVRLLAGLGAGALALLASAGWLRLDIASIKEILTVVFPSVVALVGTVIGFYFGGRAEGSASRRGNIGNR